MDHDAFVKYLRNEVNATRVERGLQPITEAQIEQAFQLINDLCKTFEIPEKQP